MSSEINFALLGYGFMGGAHLAAMGKIEGVTVSAVASRTRPVDGGPSRGNLDLPSGPLPANVQWEPDWRTVLADPAVDAVDICMPTHMHREAVLAALAAGKHVFCEKPMALSIADCDSMMAAAHAAGRIFMVAQVLRFMAPYQRAADFVRSLPSGSPINATLQRTTGFPGWGGWLGDESCSGGALLDLLSHDLDQALALFGPPATVAAVSEGPVDTACVTLRYAGGSIVTVRGGWAEPDVKFSASFDIAAGNRRLQYGDGKLVEDEREIALPEQDAYQDEVAYFVECVRNNAQPALCMPEASADAVRLALLAKESRWAEGKELAWLP